MSPELLVKKAVKRNHNRSPGQEVSLPQSPLDQAPQLLKFVNTMSEYFTDGKKFREGAEIAYELFRTLTDQDIPQVSEQTVKRFAEEIERGRKQQKLYPDSDLYVQRVSGEKTGYKIFKNAKDEGQKMLQGQLYSFSETNPGVMKIIRSQLHETPCRLGALTVSTLLDLEIQHQKENEALAASQLSDPIPLLPNISTTLRSA